jgi:two-component system OmpR family response regulator
MPGLKRREGEPGVSVRVFLVEDMKHIRDLVSELLSSVGNFRLVGVSGTEAEARLWLAEHPDAWDLAVIDLVLEQGSGIGVIPTARDTAAGRGGNVVVFSDYASDGIRNHCLRLGADAVFLKSQTRDFMDYCSELGGLAAARAL